MAPRVQNSGQNPDPVVPTNSHDPRHSPDADRASCMVDIPWGPADLLAAKQADPSNIGTAADETGIAAEIIRRQH